MWTCCPERYGKFQSEIPSTSGAICEKPQGGPLPPPPAGRGLRSVLTKRPCSKYLTLWFCNFQMSGTPYWNGDGTEMTRDGAYLCTFNWLFWVIDQRILLRLTVKQSKSVFITTKITSSPFLTQINNNQIIFHRNKGWGEKLSVRFEELLHTMFFFLLAPLSEKSVLGRVAFVSAL